LAIIISLLVAILFFTYPNIVITNVFCCDVLFVIFNILPVEFTHREHILSFVSIYLLDEVSKIYTLIIVSKKVLFSLYIKLHAANDNVLVLPAFITIVCFANETILPISKFGDTSNGVTDVIADDDVITFAIHILLNPFGSADDEYVMFNIFLFVPLLKYTYTVLFVGSVIESLTKE
jgi:hypothetical protein